MKLFSLNDYNPRRSVHHMDLRPPSPTPCALDQSRSRSAIKEPAVWCPPEKNHSRETFSKLICGGYPHKKGTRGTDSSSKFSSNVVGRAKANTVQATHYSVGVVKRVPRITSILTSNKFTSKYLLQMFEERQQPCVALFPEKDEGRPDVVDGDEGEDNNTPELNPEFFLLNVCLCQALLLNSAPADLGEMEEAVCEFHRREDFLGIKLKILNKNTLYTVEGAVTWSISPLVRGS